MSTSKPTVSSEDGPDLLVTLWRLPTRPEVHIEDEATHYGVVALCGFPILSSANARTSQQPESRVRGQAASMCKACLTLLDRNRRTKPNQH